jgi:hypothetical protein
MGNIIEGIMDMVAEGFGRVTPPATQKDFIKEMKKYGLEESEMELALNHWKENRREKNE